MKKLIITAFGGCVLLLSSCKENDMQLTYGSKSVDTTYVLPSVPATESHNVLVEEFTGQGCSNCPAAHEVLTSLKATNPGRINVIGLYMQIPGFIQLQPPTGAKYDFRDSSATDIGASIYGNVGSLPIGGVDRVYNSSLASYQITSGLWSGIINDRMPLVDSLNLAVTSTYNADQTATIQVTITYTQPVSTSQSLNIAITEDSLIDFQEFPPYPIGPYVSGIDSNYLFTNVFKGFATSYPNGDVILPAQATKEAGRVVVKTYTYKPKNIVNPAHCNVIAYVSYSSSEGALKDVIQSASAKLVGP